MSTNTTWASGRVRIPRSTVRVVCGTGEVMATRAPTTRLSSVDLPTLGRPTRATNPDRCATASSSTTAVYAAPAPGSGANRSTRARKPTRRIHAR